MQQNTIIERTQAERALHQSEAIYCSLINSLDVSVCRWLPDTTLLFANDRYRTIFGILGDPIGREWLEFLPESAREETAAFYRELAANPRTISYEHPVTVDDGQVRHYRWIDTPIFDADHQLIEFQSVGIDITERRQAEDLGYAQRDLARIISAVTTSEEAWSRCLEVALRIAGMDSGGIYLFDPSYRELRIVYHCGLGDEFVGLTSSYPVDAPNTQMILAGTPFYFGDGDLQAQALPQAEGLRALASVPIQYQGRVLGCINVASHSLPHMPPFSRHALEMIATEIGNIVVYLQTEEALRAEQERFAKVAATIPGAICTFLLRPDGAISIPYASKAFEDLYALTLADVSENIDALIARVPPAQVAQLIDSVGESARTLQPWRNEYLYNHPHKGEIWLEGYAMPVREADGSIVWHGFTTDVTERKRAEEQLRESQMRVELALKGANMGMWDWYLQTGHTVFNERWAELIGYTLAELAPISIQTWADLCHPDDMARSGALLERHFAGESAMYECEVRMRHKDGHWIWVIDRGKVVEWDAEGKPLRMTGTHLDITERKQAEQLLLELNQTLEQRVRQRSAEVLDLYENAPIGYHSLDANATVVMINQTQLSWLGYSRDELIGRSVASFLSPASMAAFAEGFPIFMQHGSVRDQEFEMVRKDGTLIPVLLSATAVYDERGEFVMTRSTVFDNSERKQADVALRESEAQSRLLFEESPDAVVLFNEVGELTQMNRAFELLTGYSAAHMLGETMDSIGLLSSESVAQLANAVIQHIRTSSNFAAVELRLRRADGAFRDVGARVFGIQIHRQQCYLVTMRDITSEKQVEETLRRANSELARAARAKDEFLANMSHELRTPLNAILGLSEALLEQVRGPLNERQQESLRNIESSGRHLLILINDILDLSKVESGKLDLQMEPVSVADVCQSSLLFVKEQALKGSLRLAFQLNDQMAEMEADPKRLKQMLVNLLSNAVKFTPAKGQVRLEVDADADEGVIRFAVLDSGIGIAAEDLERLFQPFKQLDSSLSRQHEGTGLGLALVRRLAELHGGSVTVESAPGQGSRFTISLPYRIPQIGSLNSYMSAPDIGHPDNPLHSALVVEDSESAAEQLARYLQEAAISVTVHRRGAGALEQAIRIRPNVIFLDLLMPDRSGWEVLAQLKANPHTRDIPVVIASVVDDRPHALAAGAAGCMVKPITRESLRKVLGLVASAVEHDQQQALLIVPSPAPPPPSGARILLVEDNEVNILTISDYLQARSYALAVAHNGQEALDQVDAVRPDLILMDIQMPQMDGLEAIRRLRVMPAYADVPIIALTALAMPGDRERCLAAGANEYLTKPVSLRGLAELIGALLNP